MTIPTAGWYPDPENGRQDRWWNGVSWSEQRKVRVAGGDGGGLVGSGANIPAVSHITNSPYGPASTQAGAAPTAAPTAPPASPAAWAPGGPADQAPGASAPWSRAAEARRMNNAAYLGLILSIAAWIVNPLAIVGILAIVFSSRGLAQSRERQAAGDPATGRLAAVVGFVLGIAVTGLIVLRFLAGLR